MYLSISWAITAFLIALTVMLFIESNGAYRRTGEDKFILRTDLLAVASFCSLAISLMMTWSKTDGNGHVVMTVLGVLVIMFAIFGGYGTYWNYRRKSE